MKTFITLALFIVTSVSMIAQSLMFDQSFDFSIYDRFDDFVSTDDGGYLLVGESKNDNDFLNALLVKTNGEGEMQWAKIYGGDQSNRAGRIVKSQDGNFYLAGKFQGQAYVLKVNQVGDSLTSFFFENEYGSNCTDLVELENTNLLLLQRVSLIPFSTNIILSDSDGNSIWTVNSTINEASTIHANDDGFFFVTGHNGMANYEYSMMAKFNIDGNVIFSQQYSNFNSLSICSVISDDFSMYLGGYYSSPNLWSPGLMKTNAQGIKIWNSIYFNSMYGGVKSLILYEDEFILSTGVINQDAFVLKTDTSGEAINHLTFNSYDIQEFNKIRVEDEFLLLAGFTANVGYANARFMKLNLDTLSTGLPDKINHGPDMLSIYPVPATDRLIIESGHLSPGDNGEFRIFGMDGKLVLSRTKIPSPSEIDITALDNGVYFIELLIEGQDKVIGKFIK